MYSGTVSAGKNSVTVHTVRIRKYIGYVEH
jgi:hypothetical protein